ncbi:MAG: alpha/beta hydrolase [Anaerolineae bacterium]|nr:alpha/beta hydrolase [Anaerolineae bacterium]
MSDWSAHDITVNSINIHYHRTGGNKPPLVLAHGFTDDGLCWSRLARDLEADHDLIMYDARGHGRSSRLADLTTRPDLAGDLAALVEALGLEKPGALGHSMGAAAAAEVAAAHPDLLGYVILEDPPWFAEDAQQAPGRRRDDSWAQAMAKLQTQTREEVIAGKRAESPDWADIDVETWADSRFRFDLNMFSAPWSTHLSMQEVVSKITCPALLITSDPEKGGIVTPQTAREAARRFQNKKSAVVRIGGAGHSIHREQYARFLAAVTGFLAQ